MVVFESVRNFFEILIAPFEQLFEWFPEFGTVITGILVLSLGYFGWRAIK